MLQLRAAQNTQDTSQRRVDRVEHAERDIRFRLSSELVCEASCIVALEQVCGIVDASAEVGDVDAGEGVGRAGVSTNVEELGLEMCQQMCHESSGIADVNVRGVLQHSTRLQGSKGWCKGMRARVCTRNSGQLSVRVSLNTCLFELTQFSGIFSWPWLATYEPGEPVMPNQEARVL